MFGIKLGLERMEKILGELGNPHLKYKTVHITGTNGKGSVSVMIASVLSAAGYKVGLYTSPHISDFRERIQILDENGKRMIEERDVCRIMEKIKQIADKYPEPLTYFEAGTLLAFQYFAEQDIDFGVIEVGMGGRLDATNIIRPEVSVITTIALEHTQYLGKDLVSIAREKGGIIKNETPLITGVTGEALEALKEICKQKNASLIHVGTDIGYERKGSDINGQVFDVAGILGRYENMRTKLLGKYQVFNAAVATGAIECLKKKGVLIPEGSIYDGISSAFIPGRFEILSSSPTIVLDVAHNPQAAQALADTIRSIKNGRLNVVLGIMKDKDIKSFVQSFSGIADLIIATKPKTKRAADPHIISGEAQACGMQTMIIEDVRKAFEYAKFISKPEDIICVTGSFYTVGEVRPSLIKETPSGF